MRGAPAASHAAKVARSFGVIAVTLPGGMSVLCYRQQVDAEPYLFRRVRSYLHANGWLTLRLTGERAFDRGNACVTGLFGTLTDHAWSPRWCEYFEVEPAWLPPVVSSPRVNRSGYCSAISTG